MSDISSDTSDNKPFYILQSIKRQIENECSKILVRIIPYYMNNIDKNMKEISMGMIVIPLIKLDEIECDLLGLWKAPYILCREGCDDLEKILTHACLVDEEEKLNIIHEYRIVMDYYPYYKFSNTIKKLNKKDLNLDIEMSDYVVFSDNEHGRAPRANYLNYANSSSSSSSSSSSNRHVDNSAFYRNEISTLRGTITSLNNQLQIKDSLNKTLEGTVKKAHEDLKDEEQKNKRLEDQVKKFNEKIDEKEILINTLRNVVDDNEKQSFAEKVKSFFTRKTIDPSSVESKENEISASNISNSSPNSPDESKVNENSKKFLLQINKDSVTDIYTSEELQTIYNTLQKEIIPTILERIEETKICKICMSNKIDCILVDCGHQSFCTNCAEKSSKCAICRKPIMKIVKIYLNG